MCKIKSAIILEDRVFMPNYNSHTQMLEEMNISDTRRNPNFIRAEIYPKNGSYFEDISTWKFHVDQDWTPSWYIPKYDEQRMYTALTAWVKDRNGKYTNTKELGSLEPGSMFIIGSIEHVVLDKTEEGIRCITTDFVNSSIKFDGGSNDFRNSEIRNYLDVKYYNWLSKQIGANNIVEHKVDLKSLDGLTDYGSCEAKVSLFTLDQYRKYRRFLPAVDGWWWLSTPWSTPNGNNSCCVCCVGSDGDVSYDCCIGFGVRPFCILKSSILVSCE